MHAYVRRKTSSLIHVSSHSQLLQVNKYSEQEVYTQKQAALNLLNS